MIKIIAENILTPSTSQERAEQAVKAGLELISATLHSNEYKIALYAHALRLVKEMNAAFTRVYDITHIEVRQPDYSQNVDTITANLEMWTEYLNDNLGDEEAEGQVAYWLERLNLADGARLEV